MSGQLVRRIGLPLLTAYGVGVMIGAGIYVLTGAVVGAAGVWAPVAFLLAGLVAAPSALSYGELSARMPEAAGEAAYVARGLSLPALGTAVGLAIVAAGTISSAAVLRGGAGYLVSVFDVPMAVVILAGGAILTAIAVVGVLESLAFAALLTVIEVLGLVLVVWAGLGAEPSADAAMPAPPVWAGIGLGATLAFFAFIGFEDIVNMAEEVRDPERTLPRAILLSLVMTTVIYALVAFAAARAVPVAALADSDRPLALVWETATGRSAAFLSLIAALAAMNGVLAQIVMAARVLFGVGRRTAWLGWFHDAHPRFHTPHRATILLGVVLIGTALALPVATLAGATSAILLGVFTLVNLALIRLKAREPGAAFRVPVAVPWAGLILSAGTLAYSLVAGA